MSQLATHVEDRLLDFAYGELSAAEAKDVQSHLDACAQCRGELADIQGVRRVMSTVPPAPAPQAGLESLLAYAEQAARRAQAGPAPKPSWWRRYMAPLTGACAVLVVGVVAHQVNERVGTVEELRDKAVLAKGAPSAAAAPAMQAVSTVAHAEPMPVVAEAHAEEQAQAPAENASEGGERKKQAEAPRPADAKERAQRFGAVALEERDDFLPSNDAESAKRMPRGAMAEAPAPRSRGPQTATNAMPAPMEAAASAKDAEKRAVAQEMEPLADRETKREELGGGGGFAATGSSSGRADLDGATARGGSLGGMGSAGTGSGAKAAKSKSDAPPSPPPAASMPTATAPMKPAPQSAPKQTAQAPAAAATREVELAYGDSARGDDRVAARDEAANVERAPLARKGKAEREAAEAEAQSEAAYRSAQARALSDAANQAYGDNDRELEAKLLRQAVPLAGADRPLLSGLLVRLCSAEYALGRTAQGDAACARVTEEFRGTAAARIAERQRSEHHASLQGGSPAGAQPSAPATTSDKTW